jgi:uncharacterized OB-fold protein
VTNLTDYDDLKPWRVEAGGGVRLLASCDQERGHYFFPPIPKSSPLAPRCKTVVLSGSAVLYSYTKIYPNSKTGKPPFTLVYADFVEGVRVFGKLKIDNSEQAKIGDQLRVELEEQLDGNTSYVFAVCGR